MGKKVTQIDLLANYIMGEIPNEPSCNEGAGDTAVRLLKEYRNRLNHIAQKAKLEV